MHLKNSQEEKLSSFLRRVPRPLFLAFTFEVEFFKFTLEDALIEMNPLDSRSHIRRQRAAAVIMMRIIERALSKYVLRRCIRPQYVTK